MELNGEPIIKIGRKGKCRVEFEGYKPFDIDVIEVYNHLVRMEDRFARNDKGEFSNEDIESLNKERHAYVVSVVEVTNPGETVQLTLTEVLEFVNRITEKKVELQVFFAPKSPVKQSSAENMEVRFSV